MLHADLELARRLERTEAEAGASFVQARGRLMPQTRAAFEKIAGTYCMFDGPDSPVTQTFGLGMFEPITPAGLDAIETFFEKRQAKAFHEFSPLADASALSLLNERQYQPFEFTSVMFLPVANARTVPASENVSVRVIGAGEIDLWARTTAEGWSGEIELPDLVGLGRVMASREDGPSFLAEIDGKAVATAAMFVQEGVALMAGASTIAAARKQGAQRALIAARQRYAAEAGCDLLMMCAQPGSSSQRNAERQGFRVAYTRIKWEQRAVAVS